MQTERNITSHNKKNNQLLKQGILIKLPAFRPNNHHVFTQGGIKLMNNSKYELRTDHQESHLYTESWWDDVLVSLPWLMLFSFIRTFLRFVSAVFTANYNVSHLFLLRRQLISGQGPDNALFWWLSWPSGPGPHRSYIKEAIGEKLELPNWKLRITKRQFLAKEIRLNVPTEDDNSEYSSRYTFSVFRSFFESLKHGISYQMHWPSFL